MDVRADPRRAHGGPRLGRLPEPLRGGGFTFAPSRQPVAFGLRTAVVRARPIPRAYLRAFGTRDTRTLTLTPTYIVTEAEWDTEA